MADVEVAVKRIVDHQTYGTIIDPVASLTPFTDWSANEQWFSNGVDRRTFVLIYNNSGGKRYPRWSITRTWGASDTYPMWYRAESATSWQTSPTVSMNSGYATAEIEDGEYKIFGPFNPLFYSTTPKLGIGRAVSTTWTGDSTAASGVSWCPFYLPKVDSLAGTSTTTPDESELAIGLSPAVGLTIQTITPIGVVPSFTSLSSDGGWLMPLRDGTNGAFGNRRFFWIENTSGSDESLVVVAGYYGDVASYNGMLQAAAGDDTAQLILGWAIQTISNGEHNFIGPFDDRVWAGSVGANPDDLWLYIIGESSQANIKVAAFELPL